MKPINEMNLSQLADQIDSKLIGYHLLQFDIADRLREIHDLTRWIPVEERLPTEKDADEYGFVDIYGKMGRYNMLWNSVGKVNTVTHWRRIDKPDGV